MPQDAFHIKRLSQELARFLIGGKINRITQANKDELTFHIYTGKSTVKLILSTNATGARVCLTDVEKEPAPVAPNFCMLLRKHIQNAEIVSITQYETERIIQISLLCSSDFSQCERVLHCELMGKYSNLILTQNGVVLGALKTTALLDDTHRVLLPGARYLYPAPQDKLSPLDGAGMRSRLENYLLAYPDGIESESLAKWIFDNVSGFALPTAREAVRLCAHQNLWDFLPDFFQNQPCEPCLLTMNNQPKDFFAFPVEGGQTMPSLCKAQDNFFTQKESKKSLDDDKKRLESAARTMKKKAQKRLADILNRLQDAEKAEENRVKGELLTANLYRIEKGASAVEVDNWYEENCGKIKITLDTTLSPSQNAQRYFKTYNKQKRATEILTPMKKAEESELSYAESILSSIANAECATDLKEIQTELIHAGVLRAPKEKVGAKKKEELSPFREYEYMGYKILLGRNNLQNDRLVRQADQNDIWLHTQKYHSSHAIICTHGGQVCDEVVLYAAQLCAYYSDGRNSGKIPVDYCKKKYVKKPSKSKAGFVVYTDYKTVLVSGDALPIKTV